MVTSWRRVPAGTSGAVSATGVLATTAGAAFIAFLAVLLGFTVAAGTAVFAGGLAGAAADSLLGATVQERRRCSACGSETEQHTHSCGTPTQHAGGLAWLENDAVNLISSVVGAFVSASLFL
jgi:uncharacterized membrane protein